VRRPQLQSKNVTGKMKGPDLATPV
jgi:hypothetical protein